MKHKVISKTKAAIKWEPKFEGGKKEELFQLDGALYLSDVWPVSTWIFGTMRPYGKQDIEMYILTGTILSMAEQWNEHI